MAARRDERVIEEARAPGAGMWTDRPSLGRGVGNFPEAGIRPRRPVRYPHRRPHRATSGSDALPQLLHADPDGAVLADLVLDLVARVNDGRVITTAEGLPYLDERQVGVLPAEVHRHLPGHGECLGALLRLEPLDGDAVLLRHLLLDPVHGYPDGLVRQDVLQDFLGELDRDVG